MNREKRYLRIYFSLLFVFFTILIAGSLYFNIRKEYQNAVEYATIEANASYNKDLLYRRWVAGHGGVYVPVTDSLKPNKYLQFIENRDIVTEKKQKLTLINPAFMTRQVFAIAREQYGVKGHITSLKPIRPENEADDWEKKVLVLFEEGGREYISLENIAGEEHLRFMSPMKVENSCLKCHAHQGYKAGDIRGGISVSVPMKKYYTVARSNASFLVFNHSAIYLIIFIFSALSYRGFMKGFESRNLMQAKVLESQANLEKQNSDYAMLNMEYKRQNLELIYSRDIAERREIEVNHKNEVLSKINDELKAAKIKAEENDALKTAFLQNMSHEIRTPMNAICGFSDLLGKEGLSPQKRDHFISIIQNSSRQLLSIVTDVLIASSIETKQEKINVELVQVNNLIIELIEIFKGHARKQNLALISKLTMNDVDAKIYTDKAKLTQILTNLITNALKFTPEGFIEVGYNLKNNDLEFYVKDSGIGIRPELHEIIFERFRQGEKSINRVHGGTGLGLAISKSFVDLLGGKIRVQSDEGKGSEFLFTIPYISKANA